MQNASIIPKYLYHYTSINALEKIIETRKIRFTRLDLLNDPYEGYIHLENKSTGEEIEVPMWHVYCSCWSPLVEESVAMWDIYTQCKGVRIKLPYNMFLKDLSDRMILDTMNDCVYPITPIDAQMIEVFEIKESIKKIYGPLKVIYDVDVNEVEDNSIKMDKRDGNNILNPDMYTLDLLTKGTHKINHWQYEKEYRYLLSPYIKITSGSEALKEAKKRSSNAPEYVDIMIHKEIEEVIIGPEVDGEGTERIFKILSKSNIQPVKSTVRINRKKSTE